MRAARQQGAGRARARSDRCPRTLHAPRELIACATSCTLFALGSPVPTSRNWRDARFRRQVPHGPAEEGPVLPHRGTHGTPALQDLGGGRPVRGEVILPAQEVVVYARRVRLADIDLRGAPASPGAQIRASRDRPSPTMSPHPSARSWPADGPQLLTAYWPAGHIAR